MMPTMRTPSRAERALTDSKTSPLRFDHLDRMLTGIGIWQHSEGDAPNPRHGYSIDDEARGLIVGLRHWQQGIEPVFNRHMAEICFRFIRNAAIRQGEATGCYHNFCDAAGTWLDSIGSDDSFGRTLWGLGVAHAVDAPFAPRAEAQEMLRTSLPHVASLRPLRSKAFVILGLAECRLDDEALKRLADSLADAYESTAGEDWRWFENDMTYCNARLPMAMSAAARIFPSEGRYARIGAESLDFLLKVTANGRGSYDPVGNAPMERGRWFARGQKKPPQFDQQPVDAGALVEACAAAYRLTREPRFRRAAWDAYGWYFGANAHGLPIYNPATGGVADALVSVGASRNQGAESVLSVHLAWQALQTIA